MRKLNALTWMWMVGPAFGGPPAGTLSQRGMEVFENTPVLQQPFPRWIHRGLIEAPSYMAWKHRPRRNFRGGFTAALNSRGPFPAGALIGLPQTLAQFVQGK